VVDHKDATASTRIAGRGRPEKPKIETIRDNNSSWLEFCFVKREWK
jgi:hypothetical protein